MTFFITEMCHNPDNQKATFSLATRVGSQTSAGPSICAVILVQQTFKAY
jgi:hypothetical protein